MAINLNPKDVRKVVPGEDNFPKLPGGKNDRVQMVKALEHGHTFIKGITVIYNDWTEYNTTFTIIRLLEDRTVVEVKDNGGRFGTFVLNFNSLLSGSIKNKVVEQNEIYNRHMELMEAEFNKKYQEDISRAEQVRDNYKHAYNEEVKRSAKLNEQLVETGRELMQVETKLSTVQGAIGAVRKALKETGFNARVGKNILKMIRLSTARGMKEVDIEAIITKAVDIRVQEILDEIQK